MRWGAAVVAVAAAAMAAGGGVAGASGHDAPAAPTIRRVTLTLVDTSRPTPANGTFPGAASRTLPTVVSFLAKGTRPVGSKHPLVLFATGIGDSETTYEPLYDYWVRAGYVVAAPIFPLSSDTAPGGATAADFTSQPKDVEFVTSEMLRLDRTPRSPVNGLIDPAQVSVAGKSLGAITVLEVGYNPATRDPRVKAVIALTGFVGVSGPHFTGINTPLLLEHGDADTTAPIQGSRDAYAQANSPKFFVTLFGQTHGSAFGGGQKPAEVVVERTTVDFLDRYVRGRKGALATLQRDGNVAGVASLQATP